VQKNPSNEKARSRLADFYFNQRDFAKVAELYSHAGVTSDTADETVLNVAESLDKTGNTRKAADLVESALAIRPASGPLYLALASYYQRLGTQEKLRNSSAGADRLSLLLNRDRKAGRESGSSHFSGLEPSL